MRLPPNIALLSCFILTITGAPAIDLWSELSAERRPRLFELFYEVPTAESLRQYEEMMEKSSFVQRTLRPPTQAFQFLLTHNAGRKTLVGNDNWLFYQPGVEALTQRRRPKQPTVREAVDAIIMFRDDLKKRGIRLLVMPAPNKESVYPDRLTSLASRPQQITNPETQYFFDLCKAEGIETIDLFKLFRDARELSDDVPLYLKQDSHWSPTGLRIAATEVARQIGGAEAEPASAFVRDAKSVQRHGDLIKMMQSPLIESRILPEAITTEQVSPAVQSQDSDVLVIGDSFLRIFELDEPTSAGFIAHLAAELGRPVAAIVNDGGASTLVRQQLARQVSILEGKKTLIYEFVERDLRDGTEGWQSFPLPSIASKD